MSECIYDIDHGPTFESIYDNDLIKLLCAVAMLTRHLYIKTHLVSFRLSTLIMNHLFLECSFIPASVHICFGCTKEPAH